MLMIFDAMRNDGKMAKNGGRGGGSVPVTGGGGKSCGFHPRDHFYNK